MGSLMKKLFIPLLIVAAAMFAYAPVGINNVPLESTMLLVQKIFYFHFATWMAMTPRYESYSVCELERNVGNGILVYAV